MENIGRWLENEEGDPLMTGVTARGIQAFLKHKFGKETVSRVVQESGIPPADVLSYYRHISNHDIVSEYVYKSVFMAMATHASVDLHPLLFEFGQFMWTWLTDQAGYTRSMHRVAGTLVGLIRGLSQFLLQLFMALGNVAAKLPRVVVLEEEGDTFLMLLVGSGLPSRVPVLLGMIDCAAATIFRSHVSFDKVENHTAFMGMTMRVTILSTASPTAAAPAAPAKDEGLVLGSVTADLVMGLDPHDFYELFPFHLVMDREFRVLQAGSGLKACLPGLGQPGAQVQELFELVHPNLPWDIHAFDLALQHQMTSKVFLQSKHSLLELKGGMYKRCSMHSSSSGALTHGEEVLLFLGSPICLNFADMSRHNLHLSDLPAHDMTSDYILMADLKQVKTLDLERATERLEEERLCNSELKETLAETLASQEGRGPMNTDSAIDLTIQLLNGLLLQEEVDVQRVLDVRSALLRAGANIWKPVDFDPGSIDQDGEVNAALGQLLGASQSNPDQMDTALSAGSRSVLSSTSDDDRTPTGSDSPLVLLQGSTGRRSTDSPDLAQHLAWAESRAAQCWSSGARCSPQRPEPASKQAPGSLSSREARTLLSRDREAPGSLSSREARTLLSRDREVPGSLSRGREAPGSLLRSATNKERFGQRSLLLLAEPSDELALVLSNINDWHFDSFALDRASGGRPLSCLAFHLMKSMSLIKHLGISESRLTRFLVHVEQGYPDNPYHCRVHAADVLRNMHVIMTRGGVLEAVLSAAKAAAAHKAGAAKGAAGTSQSTGVQLMRWHRGTRVTLRGGCCPATSRLLSTTMSTGA